MTEKARMLSAQLLGRYHIGALTVALLMLVSAPMCMAASAADTTAAEAEITPIALPAPFTAIEAPELPDALPEGAQPAALLTVTITADGKSKTVYCTKGLVADAIKAASITLGEHDKVSPGLADALVQDAEITVQRGTVKTHSVTVAIPFETQTKNDPTLQNGSTRISQNGVEGSQKQTFADYYLDGEKVESELLSEKTLRKPTTQIQLLGTKPVQLKSGLTPISELALPKDVQLDANGLPKKYKKIVNGTAKAYASGTLTASGRKAMPGYIAVDPKQFPYGTKLYIVSSDGRYVYGYCIAADTGGFVKTNGCTVDLRMNSNSECYAWGHRAVTIYVLD